MVDNFSDKAFTQKTLQIYPNQSDEEEEDGPPAEGEEQDDEAKKEKKKKKKPKRGDKYSQNIV